jgi:hypothetical protein
MSHLDEELRRRYNIDINSPTRATDFSFAVTEDMSLHGRQAPSVQLIWHLKPDRRDALEAIYRLSQFITGNCMNLNAAVPGNIDVEEMEREWRPFRVPNFDGAGIAEPLELIARGGQAITVVVMWNLMIFHTPHMPLSSGFHIKSGWPPGTRLRIPSKL